MVVVRPMTIRDLAQVQILLTQLGYPLDAKEVARRCAVVTATVDHAVLVAERSNRILALCHVYGRPALDKPPEAVVQALVVDIAARNSGLGRLMMAAAESWALERGFDSLTLASHVDRAAAHAFYEAIGYQRTATAHSFRRPLR